jgi:hypothetical protein
LETVEVFQNTCVELAEEVNKVIGSTIRLPLGYLINGDCQ